ncbi:hypothetical protein H2LOC_004260 [Methylocystis heyeri]|uniref:Uncharacterized protein n=2 Tax=Methylocystis heyeri TaxID=391905 RepID=A0A6B8KET4_9HYPH|nr:hypothetical protein H2LOC_004260 [Methylocystis heyeri]
MQLIIGSDNEESKLLVGPTVFAIGENEDVFIVMQHPYVDVINSSSANMGNRLVTNYYYFEKAYILRARDNSKGGVDFSKLVNGPMSDDEFYKVSRVKNFPKFSVIFRDLQ